MARDTGTPRYAASGAWRRALLGFAAALLAFATPTTAAARPVDSIAVSAQACTHDGTSGTDRLVGSARGDVVCGRDGRDRLQGKAGADRLDGGQGNDNLFGGAGPDDLRGGPGNDGLGGGFGPDDLSGGPGRDIAYYGQRVLPLRVSIGDRAKDGAAGEGDTVHADVEDIQGGRGNDVLTGNGRRNRLFGGGGNDRLRGRGGNDVLMGGGGVDRLDARDGAGSVDRIECGSGDDTALVDPGDLVDPDCENVVGGNPSPPQNQAPTGIALSNASVAENQPAGATVGTLSAGDPDPGDTHAFALVPGAGSTDNGSFQIAGSTLRTAAVFDHEAKSSYSVRIRATDFGTPAGQIVREFTITVTDANDPPTAVDDNATVGEDTGATAIDVLANDANADGGPMTIASAADPAHGTVAVTGGGTDLTYEPDPDHCNDPPGTTPDTFTYTLNGGSTATVSVTVTCADDPPLAVNDSATVLEDALATAVPVLANDTDVDGGPMTIGSAGDPANGTVVITGGGTGLTYEPDPSYCNSHAFGTPDTFTYTLNGGSTATVSVTVTCVPEDPVVDTSPGSTSYTENAPATPIDSAVTVTDPDPGAIASATIQITGGYAGAEDVLALASPGSHPGITPSVSGDTLTLTGAASPAAYQAALRDVTYRNGSESPSTAARTMTFTVTDETARTGSDTKGVTVIAVDDPPVAVNDSATVPEDAPATAVPTLANDTDVDGGPMTIGSASDPVNGAVVITGGGTGLTYQPDPNYCNDPPGTTPDTFTYTLNGGSTATVSVTVTCVPEDPVVDTSPGSTSYTENAPATPIDSAVTVSDPDPGATITGATVQITGGYAGAQDILALAGAHPGITPSVSGDTLTLTGDASPAAYQVALRDVTYRNSSESPSAAARTVTFTVTDETTRTDSDTKGITVIAVDDPPVAVADAATVLEDAAATAVLVLTNDTDVDGGSMTIGSASDPANGTVVITGGGTGLTYQPDPNYCNNPPGTTPDTFTYTLNGGSTATVSVTVTCVNDAPIADDETLGGADGAIGNTTLIVNDPDDGAPSPSHPKKTISGDILSGDTDVDGPGPLTVTAGTFATDDGGSVTIESDGDFTFHPAASTSCTDTSDFFDYTVEDSGSPEMTDTGRVTIQIAGCVWYVSNNAAGNAGTASAPFDTLVQAETASGANHTVFVFDGDGTSTGYGGDGYSMNAGERLIGEHEGLQVGADALHPANPGAHPTLTATNADVIDLAGGNELRGLTIDPAGTGGGIAGGAGDTGGTIDDVNIVDGGTAGTQAGLELNATTGTFNVTNFVVSNSATGVLLNNAGTTDFGSTTITSTGAPGLDATGTNMSTSTFDAITVTGSGNGGVSLTNTTGATTFGDGNGVDLALTTSSIAAPAFELVNAGSVTVAAAGVDNVSANGGPAIDVTGTAGAALEFDDVDSTNSTSDGINLAGLGTGTFSATSGDIGGAAGIAFDLDGGSGAVTYPGNLNNGAGQAAEITGRSGGAVTLSGAIGDTNDAGGGISLSGNTSGSTTFSNASKVLNTGTGNAVSFTSSDGHTLGLSNGGLDIDTTSGQGLVATNSGAISVSGPGNSVTSGTGRAVTVQGTDFHAGGFTFQSVSSNGAPNGILLSNTGTAAGMTITGTGATNSGGSIQNATEHGVSLTTTQNFNADELSITGPNFAGVDGTDVTNFTFTDGEILNAGDSLTNPLHGAIAFNDQAANENNIDGTLTITGNLLKDHYGGGVDVFNRNGTISDATVSSNTIDSPADEALSKEDAISFNLFGSATTVASLTKAQIEDNVITDHPSGNGITILGAQTNTGAAPTPTIGVPDSATNRILIDGNLLAGDPTLRFGGAGIQAGIEGRGVGNFDITNNGTVADPITNVGTHGIATGNSGSSQVEYLIQGNRVTANNFEAGALGIRSASDEHIMADASTLSTPGLETIIDNNVVRNTTGGGIRVLAMNSNGTSQVRVTNNDVANGAAGTFPIRVENGSSADPAFDPTMCATISANTTAANAPSPGGHTFPGIGLFKRSSVAANYEFGIVGLTPSPSTNANTEAFVTGLNPNANLGANFYAGKRVSVDAGDNFVSCTHPPGF